jgi:hypothetical protein
MKSVERQINLGVTELKNVPRNEFLMKLQIFLLIHEVELMVLRIGLGGEQNS